MLYFSQFFQFNTYEKVVWQYHQTLQVQYWKHVTFGRIQSALSVEMLTSKIRVLFSRAQLPKGLPLSKSLSKDKFNRRCNALK